MTMAKLLPVVFMAAILIIGIPYVVLIMGATDEGADLSGSDYEEQYNSTTDTSIATISIMQFMPFVVGILALLIVVAGIKKTKGRRG